MTAYCSEPSWVSSPAAEAVFQQVAAAVLDHDRHCRSGCVDVRHHVYFPHALDLVVGDLQPALGHVAGVRDEHVERAVRRHGVGNDRLDGLLVSDVDPDGGAADPISHRLRAVAVTVEHHQRPRSFSMEALDQRLPDSARTASDDGDFPASSMAGQRNPASW